MMGSFGYQQDIQTILSFEFFGHNMPIQSFRKFCVAAIEPQP